MFKKRLSKWFVELSIGKVYFKEITHKLRNDIEIASRGNVALLYSLYEYQTLNLSKKKIDNLSIEDSDKLRSKIKEMLISYNIIIEEKIIPPEDKANIFSDADIKWFENKGKDFIKNVKGNKYGR